MQDGHNRPARRGGLRIKRLMAGLVMSALAGLVVIGSLTAQSPPPATPPAANLNQLMRGLFFPHSNVIFFTQVHDPAEVKQLPEPSTSSDPLTGIFGNWQAVENSALTIADAADLLMTPGRKCSNGRDVPIANPDWVQMVTQLREAGMVAYKAALTKDQDKMLEASAVLADSCAKCHTRYRLGAANRCR